MLDDGAITRIVAAVGAKVTPTSLDRRLLAEDLRDALEHYEIARLVACEDIPTERQHLQRFQALATAAARLRDGMPAAATPAGAQFRMIIEAEARAVDPAVVNRLAGPFCPESVRSQAAVARAIEAVAFLAELLDRAAQREEFTARLEDRVPAIRLLFGVWLPPVYERHWGRAAGIGRPLASVGASGPYIRFALAVAAESGLKVGAETVAAALKAARRNRPDA